MRRVTATLFLGLALILCLWVQPVSAATYTFGDRTYTTDVPPSLDQLGPLAPGSKENPDQALAHDNAPAYILLGAVAVAASAALAAWLLIKALSIEPRWVTSSRHAFDEAGWRAANTWSEFKDWLRLGR